MIQYLLSVRNSPAKQNNIPGSLVQIRANKPGIFIASAKKVYGFNGPISLKFSAVYSLSTKSCQAPNPCVPRLSSSGLSFSLEGETVCNHGDKFAISSAKSYNFCRNARVLRTFQQNLLRSFSRLTILIGWYEYYIPFYFNWQSRSDGNVSFLLYIFCDKLKI